MRCVDRSDPAQFTLSDVAADLGVTRQTVYRYFPGTGVLFAAVGRVAGEQFTDELSEHLVGITEPSEWVVEALASAFERLPQRRLPHAAPRVRAGRAVRPLLHVARRPWGTGRELMKRSDIDWIAAGYDEGEREALVEYMLRSLQSLVIDPPDPPWTRARHSAPTCDGGSLPRSCRGPKRSRGDEPANGPCGPWRRHRHPRGLRRLDGVVPAGVGIPLRAGGVTPRWLEAAMGLRGVPSTRCTSSTRTPAPPHASIAVEHDADADVPDDLFLKFTPHNYLQLVMMLVFELGTREVFVYRTLGDELPVRMPARLRRRGRCAPWSEPDDPRGSGEHGSLP